MKIAQSRDRDVSWREAVHARAGTVDAGASVILLAFVVLVLIGLAATLAADEPAVMTAASTALNGVALEATRKPSENDVVQRDRSRGLPQPFIADDIRAAGMHFASMKPTPSAPRAQPVPAALFC